MTNSVNSSNETELSFGRTYSDQHIVKHIGNIYKVSANSKQKLHIPVPNMEQVAADGKSTDKYQEPITIWI